MPPTYTTRECCSVNRDFKKAILTGLVILYDVSVSYLRESKQVEVSEL